MIKKILNHINAYILGMVKVISYQKNIIEIKIKTTNKLKTNEYDKDLYLRLFNFYKLMKKNEVNNPEVIKPSSLWQTHINQDYKFLLDSSKNNDLESFAFFLNNFGNWDNYLGIEHNILLKRYSKNFILRSFLRNEIFLKHFMIWKDFGYSRKDLQKIATPEFGNQLGAYLDGNFVTIGSFFNQIISKILFEHIKDNKRPVICDLGGGYGKLGHFLVKNFKNSSFIDFDIPEVLVLAAYYLIKTYPNKKTLLYNNITEINDKLNLINYDNIVYTDKILNDDILSKLEILTAINIDDYQLYNDKYNELYTVLKNSDYIVDSSKYFHNIEKEYIELKNIDNVKPQYDEDYIEKELKLSKINKSVF
jgi:putative sugar O-methyltransferase